MWTPPEALRALADAHLAQEIAGLVALAHAVAEEAGRFIRDDRPHRLDVASKSSATDVVTDMDHRSEALIRTRLLAARPRDGLLGEEGADVVGDSGITWVVDPIDGTTNYLYELPSYAVSVAAVVGDPRVPGGWLPVAGAVADPERSLTAWAGWGQGAWRAPFGVAPGMPDTVRLSVREPVPLGQALIATGFAYSPQRRRAQATILAQLVDQVRDIRRLGAAALDLTHVAAGTLDGYYESHVNAWDIAAGWLLVHEAGGVVSGVRSPGGPAPRQPGPPSPDLVVAGPPELVEALIEAWRRAAERDVSSQTLPRT